MARRSTKSRKSSKLSADEVLRALKAKASPENVAGMARYGINPTRNYGVCTPVLFGLAKKVEGDHELAQELWETGIRDARLVACFMDDPELVTEEQMDDWVKDFDSWDICDGCCLHLFSWTSSGHKKAREWSKREEEYVKRAGYVMMATLATHDKTAPDSTFTSYMPLIVEGATDERNYVKKAVNWALRGIGKRNSSLNRTAIRTAKKIQKLDSRSARWIASDALRELTGEKVQSTIERRAGR
jgi:3-methyladenine DNA glycosylase AlkD